MRHQNHLLMLYIGALTLFLFTSCSGDLFSEGGKDKELVLLQLQTLQAANISANTRAATTATYPTNRLVGFFVQANEPNGYTPCNNYIGGFNLSLNKWVPIPDIFLNSHAAKIAVYAPYDITQTTPEALDLSACLRPKNDDSKDVWCKIFTASNSTNNQILTLEHVYTRLVLTISPSIEYQGEAIFTDITLEGNEIFKYSTYKLFDSEPYIYKGARGFSATDTQVLDATHKTAIYDMLLIPTSTLTGDISLIFTVNGKKMQTLLSKDKFTATSNKLEAGKQYNINLKLIPGNLKIESVSIVKWEVQGEINGGNPEYQPEVDVTPNGHNINAPSYDNDNTIIQNDAPKKI